MARFIKDCLYMNEIKDGEPCQQLDCKYNNRGRCDYAGYIEKATAKVTKSMITQKDEPVTFKSKATDTVKGAR